MGKRTARWARAHRARLGLTQPQLAEAAGISLSTVTRLERGSPVRDYVLEALEDLFEDRRPGEAEMCIRDRDNSGCVIGP